MATLLLPVVQSPQPLPAADPRPIPAAREKSSNFSDYMEKKLNAERRENRNLLGAAKRPEASGKATEKNRAAAGADASRESGKDEATTVAALLHEFVQDLQKMAAEKDSRPGGWTVAMVDATAVEKIAEHSGIDQSRLTALLEQLESNGGKMDLAEFLAVLARRLEEKQVAPEVTVPETALPFLQILLERLGVPPGDVEKISVQAVRGDNRLDLSKFLEGLETAKGEDSTTLSDWEAEQLQDLLSQAGVSERMQRALLPERYPQWQGVVPDKSLTLDRLTALLRDGVADAASNQGKVDLPAFLKDLGDILSQAGFQEKGSGFNPAVQEALSSIYDKLMESVDLSRVQVKKLDHPLGEEAFDEGEFTEETPFLETVSDSQTGKKVAAGVFSAVDKGEKNSNDPAAKPALQENPAQVDGQQVEASSMSAPDTVFAHTSETQGNSTALPTQDVKMAHVARQPQEANLQQQTFEQISQGVLRGLRNNEHHLILKLHPRELGEVKVEMLMRDEQVAVSFTMENSKVKGILESNMDQFRDSLEKQGFVLGECMVSVSHDDGGDQAWKQFELAWKNSPLQTRKESLADVAQDALYVKSRYENASASGIDLFA